MGTFEQEGTGRLKRRLRDVLSAELGPDASIDIREHPARMSIEVSHHTGGGAVGTDAWSSPATGEFVRSMQGRESDLKQDIRDVVESRFGQDVEVEFVADGNRIDVRVTDLGIVDDIESRHDDVSVANYSQFRFTVMVD